MKVLFNIGDILQVIEDNNIIDVKCVADDSEGRICPLCFFYGNFPHCQTINCNGRHFVAIERKEVQQ